MTEAVKVQTQTTNMTTIGRIEPFEEQEGSWDQYQERFEQYFIANDVTDDTRVPVTLSLI